MVLDANLLKEKLIEAWKLRSNDTSFSASLSPIISACQSEEEFRTLFTTQILTHIDSAISSNLLQSYFIFHTRSGCINESLVIEHLLSLTPSSSVSTNDIQIKFLLELLHETLKTMHVTAEQAPRLSKQLNSLAHWLCSAICIYSNQLNINEEMHRKGKEMLILISNLFLLLFTNATFYCLWLMTIKAGKEQIHWRQIQEQVSKQIQTGGMIESEVYEQILVKINHLHLSEEFHQEEIEFNMGIFNPIVSMLVMNKLHRSSPVLLYLLRFYEHVSSSNNPSVVYLRLLQASFGGYLSSIMSNNSEYQQRWSAFVHFQLPRILASSLETQFQSVKQSIETFLLHNEYLFNRLDDLCRENTFEQFFQTTLNYTKSSIREKYDQQIQQLLFYIQQMRRHYVEHVQQSHQNHQTHSYAHQILQLQRSLEKSLHEIFVNPTNESSLENLLKNLTDYIPLICALDLYYEFIHLLLSYTEKQFDLALFILCYVTTITDDSSEEFGQLDIDSNEKSTAFSVYIWLKKYWLSRDIGHALFASSLNSIEFLSTGNANHPFDKDAFLLEIQSFNPENRPVNVSSIEYLSKTISFLGELQSLSLDETKQIIIQLIHYLTNVSYSSLVHVLLWLIANHQIANDDERPWIQNIIHSIGATDDLTSTISSLFDAIKRQLWSNLIDNPLLPYYPLNPSLCSSSMVNTLSLSTSQTSTILIQSLFDIYVVNEFLDCEQSRGLYICSKHIPIDLIIVRLLTNINTSNGIYETGRALYLIFGLILFNRRSSTRSLLEQALPYLYNIKSNEFMLEPNVYSISLILNILLMLELNQMDFPIDDQFRVKPWKSLYPIEENSKNILPKYEDSSVTNAYDKLLNYSSEEMFSSDTLRPVNYFLGWFQTILWMFSRTAKPLKPFVKAKLIAQISEYLPLQFPIEKVLSILELSSPMEIEYASMVITRDYTRLRTLGTRTTTTLIQHPGSVHNENNLSTLTKNIFFIPNNL